MAQEIEMHLKMHEASLQFKAQKSTMDQMQMQAYGTTAVPGEQM